MAKRSSRLNSGFMTLLLFALFMFLTFSLAYAYNLQLTQETIRVEREARGFERELDRLLAEEAALQSQLLAVDSEAYVEDIARKQLNMVYEGDRIFIDEH